MDKFKSFIIKYKFWLAGGAVALLALYFLRGGGGGGGGGTTSTSYTTSDGSAANTYSDPSMMIAQLQAQTQLAGQTADLQSQMNIAQLNNDSLIAKLNAEKDISLATVEANKWMAQLDSQTQLGLGDLNASINNANNQFQLGITQNNNLVKTYEIEANKHIASLNNAGNMQVAQLQYEADRYKAKTERRGQDYNFVGGLIQSAGNFFSKNK